jgi:hypothetical protein
MLIIIYWVISKITTVRSMHKTLFCFGRHTRTDTKDKWKWFIVIWFAQIVDIRTEHTNVNNHCPEMKHRSINSVKNINSKCTFFLTIKMRSRLKNMTTEASAVIRHIRMKWTTNFWIKSYSYEKQTDVLKGTFLVFRFFLIIYRDLSVIQRWM